MQIPPTGASAYTPPTMQNAFGGAAPSPASAPEQDFLNFIGKTPAEQMRDQILHSLGVTQDDINKMSPEDRAKLEAKIKQLVHEKVQESVEKKTGVAVDIKV
jgi:hypothetical protein